MGGAGGVEGPDGTVWHALSAQEGFSTVSVMELRPQHQPPRAPGGRGCGGSGGGGEGLSPGLFPSLCVLTAEAKAAEAAASAYYNPGNPHNVYMPTVSRAGERGRRGTGGTPAAPVCWNLGAGETSAYSDPSNVIFPFFLRASLRRLLTTPQKIRRPSRPLTPPSSRLSLLSPPLPLGLSLGWGAGLVLSPGLIIKQSPETSLAGGGPLDLVEYKAGART